MASKSKQYIFRIRDMRFFAYHGVLESERENGGDFAVDCEYEIDRADFEDEDVLEATIDYAAVYDLISDMVTNTRYNLLEALADKLADKLIDSFRLKRVLVKVRKLNPPLSGDIAYFEVETERTR